MDCTKRSFKMQLETILSTEEALSHACTLDTRLYGIRWKKIARPEVSICADYDFSRVLQCCHVQLRMIVLHSKLPGLSLTLTSLSPILTQCS